MHSNSNSASPRCLATRVAALALGALLAACADEPTSSTGPAMGKAAAQKTGTFLFSGTQTGAPKIYVANADGSNVRQLTHGSGHDVTPSYQPGSKRFVWVRTDPTLGTSEIWTALANGGNARRLTPAGMFAANPQYSPDGNKIAFDLGPANRIMTMNADGSVIKQVASGPGTAKSPSWSPDGSLLAFQGDSPSGVPSIFIAIVGDRAPVPEPLVPEEGGPAMVIECTAQPGCSDPAFSPTAFNLAYIDHAKDALAVFDNDAVTTVYRAGIHAANPAWSKDGERVLFDTDFRQTRDIVAVPRSDVVGSALWTLTSLEGDETAPAPSR